MKKIQASVLYEICQNIPDAICIVDTDWTIRSWNRGAEDIFGYREDELIGKNIAVIMPPDIVQREIEHCRQELNAKGKMSEYQTSRLAKNGRIIPIELTAVLLKQAGEILGYASIMRDITERNRIQHDLEASEESFRMIFNSVNDAIFVHDIKTGRILEVNRKFTDFYEYEVDEIQGLDVGSLSAGSPGYTNVDALAILRRAAAGEPQTFEWLARSKTGKIFPVEVILRQVPLKGSDRILATVRDISERKQAEESLRLTQFSMDHASVCAYLIGRDARFLYVNEQACRTLGYSREELLSMAVYDVDRDYPISVWDEHWAQLKKEGNLHFETQHRKKDGTFVPVQMSLNYLSFGGREYNVAFGVDITERKHAEGTLKQAYAELEAKVRERTQQLAKINDELRMEITERQKAVELIRKSKELSDALNRLGTVIHSTLDFEEIMQRVVQEAARAMKVDGILIGLYEDGIFHVRHVYNMPEEFSRRRLTSDELRAMQYVALVRDTVAFNDAANDERLNIPFVKEMGIRSLLVSPLITTKRIAGAIAFYGLSRRIEFEEEHIDFARKLSASVSLALENAELYQALRTSERLLKAIVNSIPDMVWLKDRESRFIVVNEPIARATGKKPEDLIGKTDLDVWPKELAEQYRADDREVMKNRVQKRVEEPLAPAAGEGRWIETIKTPIYNDEGEVIGTAGIARDVTERKRMEEQIRHMAQHDALTGLPNRRLFIDILTVELAQARRHRTKLAILFLDLDRFKEINDTLGHEAGDRLLKQAASRFRLTIREADTVARIGGDEFNMILSDIARSEDVSEIALKIVNSLHEPIDIDGHQLHVTTSVGISIYPDDSDEIETLLRYADIAMYHAKESGRNTFRFYNPSINIRSLEQMKLEGFLRQTIKRGELSVLYQPQIDIKSKKIRYAEALVRWNHPDRGVLEPNEFIPLAEETGFITLIDEWVLRTACAQARAWKDSGLDSVCVTVNLSARQFQSAELVNMISTILEETGMSPHCLDLEVTESTAMSNVEQSASQLRELQEIGVHISIDDFGTGYSSLNYLKKLPIERLKIDKSFIRDIVTDQDDRAIIGAVTSMAHKMGIKIVAEGVETEEQLAFLRDSDCDEAQGFLFSRPLPPDQFRELVAAG